MKFKIKFTIVILIVFTLLSFSVLAEEINPYVVYGTGDLQTVKNAIENGVDINYQDETGFTPIMWAAIYNTRPEVIIYLLDQGADPTIENSKGNNALDCIKINDKLINTEAYARIVKEVTGETVEIKTNKYNENSKKAYRNFEFGDSEEAIKSKAKEDEKIDDSYGMYYTNIAVKSYYLSFDYFDGKMYKASFSGPSYNADYLDTKLKNGRNKLAEIISSQYGEPIWSRNIRFFDIDSGYISWSHVWELEDKTIKIGISEYEYKYSTKMWIQHLPLLEEKEAAEKAKENQNIKDSVGDF